MSYSVLLKRNLIGFQNFIHTNYNQFDKIIENLEHFLIPISDQIITR